MDPIVESISSRIKTPDGYAFGSISRLAEKLGRSRSTIKRWLVGEWTPGEEAMKTLRKIARDGKFDFAPKKSGAPGKTWRKDHNGRHVYSD